MSRTKIDNLLRLAIYDAYRDMLIRVPVITSWMRSCCYVLPAMWRRALESTLWQRLW